MTLGLALTRNIDLPTVDLTLDVDLTQIPLFYTLMVTLALNRYYIYPHIGSALFVTPNLIIILTLTPTLTPTMVPLL